MPFAQFAAALEPQSTLRAAISAATRRAEPDCIPALLAAARMPAALSAATLELAQSLAAHVRHRVTSLTREGLAQRLMQEFALTSDEGIALMCVAEALLRIPDDATRDALIRDKLGGADWQAHLGRSESAFVNAATWGLFLTGKLVTTHSERGLAAAFARAILKHGEPLLRKGVEMAMELMAEQFVIGETIEEALAAARGQENTGFRHSFDMLGEAAMTAQHAAQYLAAYERAIDAIGIAAQQRGVYRGPGISIKLSALHPRYTRSQRDRVITELYPRLCALAARARRYDIGINIDAEEAERLDLSLDLFERLCHEPALADWNGLGLVVQAYQKRSSFVIDWLIDLARRTRHRLMVRLVKGAYWDSEIKRAQIDGLEGYPVYTRKVYTDVSYLACARRMLAAPDAVYPQFATHNAHTVAAIYHMAGAGYHEEQYEFQCLHGMGEPLYEHVVAAADGGLARPCRVYAPVGTHRTLLPYLVRRLLENGANTSFVNRIADSAIPLHELVADPVARVEELTEREGAPGLPNPRIPLPQHLYGDRRLNSQGLDLANEIELRKLAAALSASVAEHTAAPVDRASPVADALVRNPAEHGDVVGYAAPATPGQIEQALAAATAAAAQWQATPTPARAAALQRAAGAMEQERIALIALAVREAGKTVAAAVAEVREAIDFLRYYAAQANAEFAHDTHKALGPVACISPWNFPLAIFTGQVSAALAAGNPVLAKPAEQTPLIAAQAVRILHDAGIPRDVLQLLTGPGETVGAALVADARVAGVVFTGSTEVARSIQRTLSERVSACNEPIPLIAETGGQNAMLVDSSALAEQAVADTLVSAFDSAGQRCSALRVLCLQEDIAERVLDMLRGAMAELTLASPDDLATDVGPVIDADAGGAIMRHIDAMRARGHVVFQVPRPSRAAALARGTFVPPTLIEIARVDELEREVFGPVLHVVRYARASLDDLIAQINATGYGLTFGIHSRIDEAIARATEAAQAGNVYVNRNMIGAVVGVQPFGGMRLSGTGPKAGGPLYLYRLLSSYPRDAFVRALRSTPVARWLDTAPFEALRAWCATVGERMGLPPTLFERIRELDCAGGSCVLPGPTGESNEYRLSGRSAVLCVASDEHDLLVQLAHVLAVGSRAIWAQRPATQALFEALPAEVQSRIRMASDWGGVDFDMVLYHGDRPGLLDVMRRVAHRPGAIAPVHAYAAGVCEIRSEWLLSEKTISVNTAAAGGNAGLMAVG